MRRNIVVLLSIVVLLCVASCSDDDSSTNSKPPTIVGNWIAIELNGEAVGGIGQDYIAGTFTQDLSFSFREVWTNNPTDTSSFAGTYRLVNDTLAMHIKTTQGSILLQFPCIVTPTHMSWDVSNVTDTISWLFARR